MPISFLLSYEHYDADTLNVTADTVSAGVRYNFGTTLKTRSTSGGDLASITGATAVLF